MGALTDRIEYDALRGFFALCRSLSPSAALRLARFVGDLLFDLVRIRRRVALSNLAAAFPDLRKREVRRIARACFRNFAKTAVEFARLPVMTEEELLAGTELEGREHLEAAASLGRGVILVTGHFGNWEWMGPLFPLWGYPIRVIAGRQRNRLVEGLLDRVRASRGVGILSAERDLRMILEAVRGNEFVAIVADQDAGRDGLFVDFLGRPASTAAGPVRLARRFGVPIVQGFAIHRPEGGIRMVLEAPFVVPKEGGEEEVLLAYTKRWTATLERYVRLHPDQWFWMHRRWKTRPGAVRDREEETG